MSPGLDGVKRTVRRHETSALAALGVLPTVVRPAPTTDPAHLRVLAHTGTFVPSMRGGSELSLAATLDALRARGHRAHVLVDDPRATTGHHEGFDLLACPSRREALAAHRWADVVLTQMDARSRAMRLAAWARRPVVHLVHTDGFDLHTFAPPHLRVFAARWLADTATPRAPALVLHPLVAEERYRVAGPPGDAITVVNLTRAKGGEVLGRLAARLPERRFLGVRGAWGEQVVPDPLPPNLEVLDTVADPRVVYARTRVLLAPSEHELLPRVPLEAAWSGIPTIATPLPGFREALGAAGRYVPLDDLDAWVAAVRALDDPVEYRARSAAARARAEAYRDETAGELDAFAAALVGLATARYRCPGAWK